MPESKVDGHAQRQLVSDELRQLKQMSRGLRSKAMRSLMERHAAKLQVTTPVVTVPVRPAKPAVRPVKATSRAAAA